MFLEASTLEALLIVGAVGGLFGLMAGFMAGADSLFGTFLMGVIGGLVGSAIMNAVDAPEIYAVGDGFSVVWAAVGGLILGFVVGRSNV